MHVVWGWGWVSLLSKGTFTCVVRAHADLWKCWVSSITQKGIKGNPGGENDRTRGLGRHKKGMRGKGGREKMFAKGLISMSEKMMIG